MLFGADRLETLINLRFAEQATLITTLKELIVTTAGATQADLDALAASLAALQTQLAADVTNIEAEIAALKVANPTLDLTGVDAAVSSLTSTVSTVNAIAPTPPAPPAPAA